MTKVDLRSAIYEASKVRAVDIGDGHQIDQAIKEDYDYWLSAKDQSFSGDKVAFLSRMLQSLKLYQRHFKVEDPVFLSDEEGYEYIDSGHGGLPSRQDDTWNGFLYESIEGSLLDGLNSIRELIPFMQYFSNYIVKVENKRQEKRSKILAKQDLSLSDKDAQLDLADKDCASYLFAFPLSEREENECVGGHFGRLRTAHLSIDDNNIQNIALERQLNDVSLKIIKEVNLIDSEGRDLLKPHVNAALRKLIGFSDDAISDRNYQYVIDSITIKQAFDYIGDFDKSFDLILLKEACEQYANEIVKFGDLSRDGLKEVNVKSLFQYFNEINDINGFGFHLNEFFEFNDEYTSARLKSSQEILLSVFSGESYLVKRINEEDFYRIYLPNDIADGSNVTKIVDLIQDIENENKVAAGLFALYLLSQKFSSFEHHIDQFLAIITLLNFDKDLDDINGSNVATNQYFINLKSAILDRAKDVLSRHRHILFDGDSSIDRAFLDQRNQEQVKELHDHAIDFLVKYPNENITIKRLQDNSSFKSYLMQYVDQDSGKSFLMMAIENRMPNLVSKLVDEGADIRYFNNQDCSTPIIVAVRSVNLDALRLLILRGVDLGEIYYSSTTQSNDTKSGNILHFLHEINNVEGAPSVINELLSNMEGACLNIGNKDWKVPLQLALENNAMLVAHNLLQDGRTDIQAKDNSGQSLLHAIVSSDGGVVDGDQSFAEVSELLISKIEGKGLLESLSQPDNQDKTPLHILAANIKNGDKRELFRALFSKMSLNQVKLGVLDGVVMLSALDILFKNLNDDYCVDLVVGLVEDAANNKNTEKLDLIVGAFESLVFVGNMFADFAVYQIQNLIPDSNIPQDCKDRLMARLGNLEIEYKDFSSPARSMSRMSLVGSGLVDARMTSPMDQSPAAAGQLSQSPAYPGNQPQQPNGGQANGNDEVARALDFGGM